MTVVLIAGRARDLVTALAETFTAEGARVVLDRADDGPVPDRVVFAALGRDSAEPERALRSDWEDARELLERCDGWGAPFTFVAPEADGRHHDLETYLVKRGTRVGFAVDAVRCGPVLPALLPEGGRSAGVALLASCVRWVAGYVRERDERYLDVHPLRILGVPDARLELIAADEAAQAIAWGRPIEPRTLPLSEVIDVLGGALGCDLRITGSDAELTAIDRLLAARLGGLTRRLTEPGAPTPSADPGLLRQALAAGSPVPAPDRDGPPVILLNALGQGDGYWTRLTELLGPGAILHSPRRTRPDGEVVTFDEQVDDLSALLAAEGPAHLVGWCTAAKTAFACQNRHPELVLSLTMLNPALRAPGRPEELDSEYEQQLATVARTLAVRPGHAGRMLRLFTAGLFGQVAEPTPEQILATPHPALEKERRLPFADAGSLLVYTSQLRDFWSREVKKPLSDVPVLFVAGDLDPIVSLDGIRAAAGAIPGARMVELPAATHYAVYERAREIAELVTELIKEQPEAR